MTRNGITGKKHEMDDKWHERRCQKKQDKGVIISTEWSRAEGSKWGLRRQKKADVAKEG